MGKFTQKSEIEMSPKYKRTKWESTGKKKKDLKNQQCFFPEIRTWLLDVIEPSGSLRMFEGQGAKK